MPAPDDVAVAVAAHARLLDAVKGLANPDVRRPSQLPGWTIGHLVTHLARNADGLRGIFEAAADGRVEAQYPGGPEQRDGDIEAGAQRPAKTLRQDLADAQDRLESAWAATTDEVWVTGRGLTAAAGELAVAELPFRRLREVEVHHVDLGLGYEPTDWPAAFVDGELQRGLARLDGRLGADDRAPLAAWLLGRGTPEAWPELGPWG